MGRALSTMLPKFFKTSLSNDPAYNIASPNISVRTEGSYNSFASNIVNIVCVGPVKLISDIKQRTTCVKAIKIGP